MNVCIFSGRLARDPEVRTAGQNTVLSFSIANDTGYGDKKVTTWIRCSYWNHDKLAQYLHKGDSVTVSGEISLHEYQGKANLELRVSDLVLPPKQHTAAAPAQRPVSQPEEKLPF